MQTIKNSYGFEPSQLHKNGDLSPVKPRQKMPTIYRHRRASELPHQEPEGPQWPRDNSYIRKRLDKAVQMERQEMLMKTGRTSFDNPEWMSVNFDRYRRVNYSSTPRPNFKQDRYYDVLNNPKRIFGGRNEDRYFIKMQGESPEKPAPIDLSALRRTMQHSQLLHGEVSGKVGSLDQRDYTIRRPLLKIGKDSFVDTYSPF